jgi:hypothetical protein
VAGGADHVGRIGVRHRLHDDGMVAANPHLARTVLHEHAAAGATRQRAGRDGLVGVVRRSHLSRVPFLLQLIYCNLFIAD